MTKQVDILLATYQGEAHIEEQIDSLLNQTYPFIRIWIRDDYSSDQTPFLIRKLAQAHPSKISILSSKENGGIKKNFSALMTNTDSQAPYIMFSDQDDYWLPHKVELSLKGMYEMEKKWGEQVPLLIHTDLKIVDSHLKEISSSFWRYTHLNPQASSLNRLLAQNIVTGCTMLMNRPLLNLAKPIPLETVMHDWWIALVASAFGYISHLNQPTLLYRQHTSNDIGAKRYHLWRFLNRTAKEAAKHEHCLHQTYQQAQILLERYHSLLKSDQKQLLQIYASLPHLPYLEQKKQILKYHFFKQGFLRNVKTLLMR